MPDTEKQTRVSSPARRGRNPFGTLSGYIIRYYRALLGNTPVHELSHIEYVLQKLEEEIYAFREMLRRLNKRRAIMSAVGSVLKWVLVRQPW